MRYPSMGLTLLLAAGAALAACQQSTPNAVADETMNDMSIDSNMAVETMNDMSMDSNMADESFPSDMGMEPPAMAPPPMPGAQPPDADIVKPQPKSPRR